MAMQCYDTPHAYVWQDDGTQGDSFYDVTTEKQALYAQQNFPQVFTPVTLAYSATQGWSAQSLSISFTMSFMTSSYD